MYQRRRRREIGEERSGSGSLLIRYACSVQYTPGRMELHCFSFALSAFILLIPLLWPPALGPRAQERHPALPWIPIGVAAGYSTGPGPLCTPPRGQGVKMLQYITLQGETPRYSLERAGWNYCRNDRQVNPQLPYSTVSVSPGALTVYRYQAGGLACWGDNLHEIQQLAHAVRWITAGPLYSVWSRELTTLPSVAQAFVPFSHLDGARRKRDGTTVPTGGRLVPTQHYRETICTGRHEQ
ncbi:hypothetical protein F5884DRAFT_889843 [Xylogone sp. PMI_703]|nr:hypothetical protein F5884DRAFT_889843 [Xylogone sp. PMI_703]